MNSPLWQSEVETGAGAHRGGLANLGARVSGASPTATASYTEPGKYNQGARERKGENWERRTDRPL